MVTKKSQQQSKAINHRSIALPSEHGAWGFLLEPLLMGMMLAPSAAGVWLCVTIFAIFLIHQPLKVALKPSRKSGIRTRVAWRYVLVYTLIALIGFALTIRTDNQSGIFLVPFLLAVPLMLVQAWYDAHGQSRALIAELCGSAALGAAVTALVLLAGWGIAPAFALWGLLLARTIPSIIYVRARLRRQRGQTIALSPTIGLHGLALLLVALLAGFSLLPWLSVPAIGILMGRAWYGLQNTQKVRASRIGMAEMAYGLLVIGLTVLGYIFNA
ncbi:YwiC-like family protein [Phototrophicus methaneseepsis]|uniref:YwiC-like family protein n=2 Tax=Phototrophicus methaneseepsis TaxID=2710758 RepID=A0A7S8ECI2_9CHLR|nr:YwiC-like family protein [Phototrophicus methaneseepsis]